MKKTVCLILSLLFLLPALFACNGAPETTTGETTEAQTTEEITEAQTTEEETEPPETTPEFNVVEDPDATLTLPRTFGSHMVLQRDADIKVFGKSNSDGAVIRGTFKEQTAYTVVENGEFTLKFAPEPASAEPAELLVEDDKGNSVKYEDVLVGDVWLFAGQSNANISLSTISAAIKKVITYDEDETMRLFMQTCDYYTKNPKLVKNPCDDFPDPNVCWKKPDKEACLEFCALGFFFARRLTRETGIPVGAIVISANGAQIQEIMSKEAAKKCKLTSSLKVKPGGFYNGMTNPLIGISFKGMVFFQGESEGIAEKTSKNFATYLQAYVDDMKTRFGFDFAFYSVQLSSYSKSSLPGFNYVNFVRFGQYDGMVAMGNENHIPSYDLRAPDGYSDFMHSPRKEELADRILNLVLAKEYGIGDKNDFLAPTPAEIKLSEDKTTVTVKFNNIGEGLTSKSGDENVNGFYVGSEKKMKKATAEIISSDTVLVHVPEGAETVKIAYAYDVLINEENTQLYNGKDLPALAFWLKIENEE